MVGTWIRYHGPQAADFADVAAAAFFGGSGSALGRYTYPQGDVLAAYLGTVADVRYSGLFDRPLPYRPVDPVRVALPALPWVFAACVVAFLSLSVRPLLRPPARLRRGGTSARLAGLTALAVEISALAPAAPEVTRAIGQLRAARSALDDDLPDRHVATLLDRAQAALDAVGRALEFPGYRPADYLRGRLG
jgi:hypothetical protein